MKGGDVNESVDFKQKYVSSAFFTKAYEQKSSAGDLPAYGSNYSYFRPPTDSDGRKEIKMFERF